MRRKKVIFRLVSIRFNIPLLGIQQKQTVQNLRLLIERYTQTSLGLVSTSHFVYNFSRKMFFTLHSIN